MLLTLLNLKPVAFPLCPLFIKFPKANIISRSCFNLGLLLIDVEESITAVNQKNNSEFTIIEISN
jgi:hypothetical protein